MDIYDVWKCFISVLSGNVTVFSPPVKFLSLNFFRNNIPNNTPDELWLTEITIYMDQIIIILLKSPGDDDTLSGGHVSQRISSLGYDRGYLVVIVNYRMV